MKKLMVITGLLLVVTLLLPVSCAPVRTESEEPAVERVPTPPVIIKEPAPIAPMAPLPPPPLAYKDAGAEALPSMEEEAVVAMTDVDQSWATERMIVRTGDMSLVVEDIPIAIDQITKLAEGIGGYVVSSRMWEMRERLVGTIAIRVPAEDFTEVMETLRELAVDVTSESTSSRDVTEEYVDLTAKLNNLEATEEQLLRLMEKAETVKDILDVQRELSRTRGEIEQTKGRMQYLERTSATSLIDVRLEQAKLDVNFTADKTRVAAGEEVQFISQIAGGFAPYSYEWDFGDGNTSTGEFPTHTYRTVASYTVSLKVTDDRGNTDTETRSEYIVVLTGWSAGSVASEAWSGLVAFGHALADIFIWIGIFSPIWLVIGGVIGVIYWRRRRKKAD